MALFSTKKEEKPSVKEETKAVIKASALSVPSKKSEYAHVLLRPMVTEKVHRISSLGQYAFFVRYETSKLDIKNAVENLYSVHVKSISTSRVKPKKRVRGKEVGYTRRMKKAIVSLRKGETISLFEGV